VRVGEVPETVAGRLQGGRLRCRSAPVTQDSRPPAPLPGLADEHPPQSVLELVACPHFRHRRACTDALGMGHGSTQPNSDSNVSAAHVTCGASDET